MLWCGVAMWCGNVACAAMCDMAYIARRGIAAWHTQLEGMAVWCMMAIAVHAEWLGRGQHQGQHLHTPPHSAAAL
jgi:hypothetical protein